MNKDVIYIDTEDDITAIIGKVKSSSDKIIALVPPKRIGVLQSAVNLKLLQKAAGDAEKRVVLITSDHSLTALAAGVKIPVAKNLQSRPEVPVMHAPEAADEEVINGADLPVGDVASSLGGASAAAPAASVADNIAKEVNLADAAPVAAANQLPKKVAGPAAPSPIRPPKSLKNKGSKIPNFGSFRKKIFIFGGLGVLLIAFLVWALVFAPSATVKISAKTTAVNIDHQLALDPTLAQSDAAGLKMKAYVQQVKKSVATQFNATGQKNIGNKASGNLALSNHDSSDPVNVAAGTTFTGADGHTFTTNAAVSVPGATINHGSIQSGTANVAVTATDVGAGYNVAAQSYTTSSYDIQASGTQMSGGSDNIVTVVSQDDVDKAKQQLSSQQVDLNQVKTQLKQQFKGDYIIIDESFTSTPGTPSVSPDIGQQAQQAKVTLDTTYSLIAITRGDAQAVLQDDINAALQGKTDQQKYTLGDNNINFQNFQQQGSIFTVRLTATGFIGPKIDTTALAKQLTGKQYGDIQAIVDQIPGVNNVTINFSPFWVTKAPAPNKIHISFTVANDGK